MAVMDIQVSPRRRDTVSVSEAVIAAHEIISESGLKSVLHPMGTCVEGSPEELYNLALRIHLRIAEMGYDRIGMLVKIDDRRDKPQSMQDKLDRVKLEI